MKVAILGCGPTGLIAAHAAATLGHEVTIFSRRVKSKTFGAMYLHEPIPGVSPTEPELEVHIVKLGTREGYARNVYGDPKAEVSWDKFRDGPTPGWDLSATYSRLWGMYDDRIMGIDLTGPSIDRIGEKYQRVFSTIPTQTTICRDWAHKFEKVEICVVHGQGDPEDRSYMYYNGFDPDNISIGIGSGWYRYSVIRGYHSWEYAKKMLPYGIKFPDNLNITYGIKPLRTDCDCRPWIHRLGRFGKWHKHAFTHHAYSEVRNALLSV